jgi:hypothetical protein
MSYNASPLDFNIHLQQFSLHNQDPTSPASDTSSIRRRRKDTSSSRSRVSKACERCRVRKVKCDGGKPCVRCVEVDDICDYTRKSRNRDTKEYSQSYVDQLLDQNAKYKSAMRVLYANRRLSIHPDDMKVPTTEGKDVPLVHDILDRLGLLQGEDNMDKAESESSQEMPSLRRMNTISSSIESVGWASNFDFDSNITPKATYAPSSSANTDFANYNMDFNNNGYFDSNAMQVEEPAFDFELYPNVSYEDLEAVGNLMNQNQYMGGMLGQQIAMPPSMFENWS